MKKIVIATVALLSILGILTFNVRSSSATPTPPPSTIDSTGSINDLTTIDGVQAHGLFRPELIQPSSSDWSITLYYTPLNGSASVTVTSESGAIIDNKLVSTNSSGVLSLQESTTQPVYVSLFASSWHLVVQ